MAGVPPSRVSPRAATIWFLALLAIAAAVRTYHITTLDMWTDEVHTLSVSRSGEYSFGPAYRTAPINFMLTAWAIRALGPSELGVRIVPLLAGLLTVALVYLFGRRWVGNRAALFATLIVALSVWHVFWSQTGRHFALMALGVLVGLHGFLLSWREGSRRGAVLLVAGMLTALFVHSAAGFYVAALLAFVVGQWVFRAWRYGERRPAARWSLTLVALLVPLAIYVPIYVQVGRYLLANTPPWNPLWNLFGSFAFYLPPWLSVPAVGGALFLAAGDDGELGVALLTFTIVPVLLLAAASFFTIASSPYCLPSLFAVSLLAGVALDRLLALPATRVGRWACGAVAGGVVMSQVGELTLYHSIYNGLKPRWREVAHYIDRHRQPGDTIVAAEADVVGFYLGGQSAMWLDKYSWLPDSSRAVLHRGRGIWFAVYLDESSLFPMPAARREELRHSARFAAVFPLNYGPKDRTIAVFYRPAGALAAPAP